MTQESSPVAEHSIEFLEMAFRTDKMGRMAHPDGWGRKTGACKDSVAMFLTVAEERIAEARFELDGCMFTHACANTVSLLVEGRAVDEAWDVTPDDVAKYLGSLPDDHLHCAELAVGALYLALADYQAMKREPWKKLYR